MIPTYNEKFMRRAIELSELASIIKKTGGVFGAVIVKDNEIISEGYNQVKSQNDPTWHAEMQAIREAAKKLQNPYLHGCILYTSSECCPMCLCASYWACIEHIFFASRVEDAVKYGDSKKIDFYGEVAKKPEDRLIKMTEVMRTEAVEVWKKYAQLSDLHR